MCVCVCACVCVRARARAQLAFLMEHMELKDDVLPAIEDTATYGKQLRNKLRCEVPGFEHNAWCDYRGAHGDVKMQEG